MSLKRILGGVLRGSAVFALLISIVNCGKDAAPSSVVESTSNSSSANRTPALPDQICDIKGGAGLQIRAPFTTSVDECSIVCDQYAYANPNRTCLFGVTDVALRADCEIAGGGGLTITPVFRATRGECTTECQKFEATNPNRVCKFGYTDIAPQAICDIKGGAGLQLAPLFQGTRGQCQLECNKFSAANPNRVCDWSGTKMVVN